MGNGILALECLKRVWYCFNALLVIVYRRLAAVCTISAQEEILASSNASSSILSINQKNPPNTHPF